MLVVYIQKALSSLRAGAQWLKFIEARPYRLFVE
jgi:hypothetical protein